MEDDVLTYEEAAKLLKVSERTLERWVSSGDVPHVKYPERGTWSPVRFLRSQLLEWLRSHAVKPRKVS